MFKIIIGIKMKFDFLKKAIGSDALVVGLFSDNKDLSCVKLFNNKISELVSGAVVSSNFTGKLGDFLDVFVPECKDYRRLLIVGMGKKDDLSNLGLQKIGNKICNSVDEFSCKGIEFYIGDLSCNLVSSGGIAANISYGFLKEMWRFNKYKTANEQKRKLEKFTVITNFADDANAEFESVKALSDGLSFCKDLASEPGNQLYPTVYAERIKEELKPLGIKVQILNQKEMTKLGMECLLAVGRGSIHEPQMLVLHWDGGIKDQKPLAFVGKGVTFDSGGISIKPSLSMSVMKYDMSGSAAVVGLMKNLALRKAKVNVIGVVALVENMPSGDALRPGDVLKSMSGKTVEVVNTDAEGRLVLADALWYTQKFFAPQFIVNLATLTGAVVSALGSEYAGLMSNNDELAKRLYNCGQKSGDKVWRLPLDKAYADDLNSYIADYNHSPETRKAGSIMGGQFLQHFVNGLPWAHLDIAGTAWTDKLKTTKDGATGFGVQLLDCLIRDYYEI